MAICLFAVAVVVVAIPDWTIRTINLDYGINHAERLLDQRISGRSNPKANQLEKSCVDDFTLVPGAAFVGDVDDFPRVRLSMLAQAQKVAVGVLPVLGYRPAVKLACPFVGDA